MKAHDLKEDRLRAHYIEQLEKLGYKGVKDQSIDNLTSLLSQARQINKFKEIDRDSAANAWFE